MISHVGDLSAALPSHIVIVAVGDDLGQLVGRNRVAVAVDRQRPALSPQANDVVIAVHHEVTATQSQVHPLAIEVNDGFGVTAATKPKHRQKPHCVLNLHNEKSGK